MVSYKCFSYIKQVEKFFKFKENLAIKSEPETQTESASNTAPTTTQSQVIKKNSIQFKINYRL